MARARHSARRTVKGAARRSRQRGAAPAPASRHPRFEAMALNRHPVWVSPGTATRTLLLFFCSCGDCDQLARRLAASPYGLGQGLVVIGVLDSSPQQGQRFQEETRFPGMLLVDPNGQVKRQYEAGRCPSAWFVDRGGRLRMQHDHVSWPVLQQQLALWSAAS